MSTWHQVNRLDIRTQWLGGNGTDPALPALMARYMRMIRRMFIQLGINLKVKLDHIPERFDPSTENLFAVGLGADALGVVSAEQELEHGVFVVKVSDRV